MRERPVAFDVASSFLALIQRQESSAYCRENHAGRYVGWKSQIQTFVDNGARTIADLYQQQANVAGNALDSRWSTAETDGGGWSKVDLMQTLSSSTRQVRFEVEAPEELPLLPWLLPRLSISARCNRKPRRSGSRL